ncbi:MAG: preprotein translocase subunit SecA, partial [Planctomycetia bacterium]|nr:preprotein translocase subunit SecA [Planctomycetia bacterium]
MIWNWPTSLAPRLRSSINASTYRVVDQIERLEDDMKALDDTRLKRLGRSLSYRARSGEPPDDLLVETFAATREAGRRTLGMRHYDVQLLAGIALVHGSIVEMQTGEGKTLVATLPLVLYALSGRGAHLATVNDYLARRDAEWMEPIFNALGMTVGIIESEMDFDTRRAAYAKDVTYGTAKEFGFDFLKDRLMQRELKEGRVNLGATLTGEAQSGESKLLQRPYWFALVDEADNVLIDEARTPLIISSPDGEAGEREQRKAAVFHFACDLAKDLAEDVHYEYDPQKRSAELLGVGRSLVRAAERPRLVDAVSMLELYDAVELALRARIAFIRDRQYVIREKEDGSGEEVVIIDEFTGRIAEGRSWRDGLHQAVEAKEGIEVKAGRGGHAARITIQDLFARWPHLAGMTGTIATSAGEIARTYDVGIAVVPTNRPAIRERLKPVVCRDYHEKLLKIVEDIKEVHATGRPILVGTRSIDKSEDLSKLLAADGLPHTVLNARNVATEAEIVAAAGGHGQITVSTNMAGRGTDIKLGEGVQGLGGLHVICTELHDSARIDRQLVGRCGRQGDPGTWRQFLALDDDILVEGYGPGRAKRIARRLERQLDGNPERLVA